MYLWWSMQCFVYVIPCKNMFPNSHENYQEMEYKTEIVDLEKATTQMGDCSTGTVLPKSLHYTALRYIKIYIPDKKLNSQKDTVWLQKSIGIGSVGIVFVPDFSNQFRLGLCFAWCMDFFGTPRDLGISLHRWKLLERTVELIFGIVWPGYLQNLCRELLRCCWKLSTCTLTS